MDIIIRDDDISYFTKPQFISQIYKNCFQNGIKISIGIIPNQKTIGIKNRKEIPKKIVKNKIFEIEKNKKLIHELQKLAKNKNEICMHGINHIRNETKLSTTLNYIDSFKKSKTDLETCIKGKIETYISPFAIMSKPEIQAMIKLNMNISTSFFDYYKNIPIPLKHYFLKNYIHTKRSGLFLTDEYLFGTFTSKKKPKNCLENAKKKYKFFQRLRKPFIIINHSWEFINDDKMLKYWNIFVDWMLTQKNNRFTTFSEYQRDKNN